MNNKKLALFFIIVVLILSLIGCTRNNNEDVDKLIIEKAKALEINEYQMIMLQISYDEFKENMEDVVVDINYFDNKQIFGYYGVDGNRVYLAKDLVGLTLEEIKLLAEDVENDLRKQHAERGWDYDEFKREMYLEYSDLSIEVKISDVYDYNEHNWKYIYSQTYIKYNNEKEIEQCVNKRYRFVEENGDWKIQNVDQSYVQCSDDSKTNVEQLKRQSYQTFNNEPIEYIEVFNLINR